MPGNTTLNIPFLLGSDAATILAQTFSAAMQQINSLITADRGRLTELERQGLVADAQPGGSATSGATTTVPTVNSVSAQVSVDRVYAVSFGCDIGSTVSQKSLALVELIAIQGQTVNILRRVRVGSDGTATSQRVPADRTVTWRPAASGAWTLAVRVALASASGGIQGTDAYIICQDAGKR